MVWTYEALPGGRGARGLLAEGTLLTTRTPQAQHGAHAPDRHPTPQQENMQHDRGKDTGRRWRRRRDEERDAEDASDAEDAQQAHGREAGVGRLLTSGRMKLTTNKSHVGSRQWRSKVGKAGGGLVTSSLRALAPRGLDYYLREWKQLTRSELALKKVTEMRTEGAFLSGLGAAVSMRDLDHAIRLLHHKLTQIFENPGQAFVFFDPDGSYTISFVELKRGLYRLNLHEMWGCREEECVKFCCVADDGWATSGRHHQYIRWTDGMVAATMRLLDTNLKDGVVDFLEWAHFMDWSLVDVPVLDRAHTKGSVFVRSQEEQSAWLARMEKEYGEAWHKHIQVKDVGA